MQIKTLGRFLAAALFLALPLAVRAQPSDSAAFPTPAAPVIPARIFKIADYGAVGDGKTRNTAALQKAIDACGAAGGGTVEVPEGRFLTGPLHFVSGMNLHLAKGAVLLLSDNPADFPITNKRYQDAFTAKNCHDLKISGEGTIDGQGAAWWARFHADHNMPHRPFLIVLGDCERVRVEGVTLTNSPMFHLVPQRCREVAIENITIKAPADAANTDGIDPSGLNFHIAGCTIDTGDDNIALKPGARVVPDQPACTNFLIEKCTFRHGHGMSIGGGMQGGVRHLLVRDCTFEDTDAGPRLKAPRGNGGIAEDLVYERLTLKRVKVPFYFTCYYPSIPKSVAADPAQPVNEKTPIWRHIVLRDITVTDSPEAGRIYGLAEMPISDVSFVNVHIAAKDALKVAHAKGITFEKSDIAVRKGPAILASDAEITGFGGKIGPLP